MIEIYTRDGCSHCIEIKQFLSSRNVDYIEMKIGKDVDREEVLSKFPDQKSLPIIVLCGDVVGHSELKFMIENKQLSLFD